jgi:hypothetical protein
MAPISEKILQMSALHCNHYYVQSFEWYRQIKIPRGSAAGSVNNDAKSIPSYNLWDSRTNQLLDQELPSKYKINLTVSPPQKVAYYGCDQYINVTDIVTNNFCDHQNKIIVIDKKVNFNQYFGDPMPYTAKFLIVRVGYTLHIYPEQRDSQIVLKL